MDIARVITTYHAVTSLHTSAVSLRHLSVIRSPKRTNTVNMAENNDSLVEGTRGAAAADDDGWLRTGSGRTLCFTFGTTESSRIHAHRDWTLYPPVLLHKPTGQKDLKIKA